MGLGVGIRVYEFRGFEVLKLGLLLPFPTDFTSGPMRQCMFCGIHQRVKAVLRGTFKPQP